MIKSSHSASIFLGRNNTDDDLSYAEILVIVDEKFWTSKRQLLLSFVAACMFVVGVFTAWILSLFVLRGIGVIIFSLSRKIVPKRLGKREDFLHSDCSCWYDSKKGVTFIHHFQRNHGHSHSECLSRCSSSSSSWGSFHTYMLASDSSTDNSWTPKSATCSLSSSTITKMFRTEFSDEDEL